MMMGSGEKSSTKASDFIAAGLVVLGLKVGLEAFSSLREPAHELAFRWYELRGRPFGSPPWDAMEGTLAFLLGTAVGGALIRYARPLSRVMWRGERRIQLEIGVTKEQLLCLALFLLGVTLITRAIPGVAHIGSRGLWAWPGMGSGLFSAASIGVHLFLGGFLFCAPDRAGRLLGRFQKP